MAKKIISLLLIIALMTPFVSYTAFADTAATIYINETFDDYAFNETATGSVSVTAGVAVGVTVASGGFSILPSAPN